MSNAAKPITIDKTSRVTVGFVLAAMVALLALTGRGTWIVADLNASVNNLDKTLAEFREAVLGMVDQHTVTLTANGKEIAILKTRQDMQDKRLEALEGR